MTDARRRESGFTLLEVIVAVFLFAVAMGALIEAMSRSLRQLGLTRDEIVASELAQRTMNQVTEKLARGEEVTSENGSYEDPDYMRYELTVEPYTIPIPEGVDVDPRSPALSAIFTPASVRADTEETPLRRVVLRVFREERGPESALPLVALIALPGGDEEGGGGGQDGDEQKPDGEGDPNGGEGQSGTGGRGGRGQGGNGARPGGQQQRPPLSGGQRPGGGRGADPQNRRRRPS